MSFSTEQIEKELLELNAKPIFTVDYADTKHV